MADGSHIEWTDATWNPLVGCTKVSPGCDNCYADGEVTRRHAAALSPKTSPKMLEAFPAPFATVSVRPDRFLLQPLRWREPRKVFVNSLSDLFHADVPDAFIAQVFAVMSAARQHTFQLLTKRHARMRSLLSSDAFVIAVADALLTMDLADEVPSIEQRGQWWPLPNVWLGVSVEDQQWADIRIPALLKTPAAVRWISAEPLLGPIDLHHHDDGLHHWLPDFGPQYDDGSGEPVCQAHGVNRCWMGCAFLDWVVVGGESGPRARPMHPDWARALRDQCDAAGVRFLFKQWGEWTPDGTGQHRVTKHRSRYEVKCLGPNGEPWTNETHPSPAWAWVYRKGKTAAGRELDGRSHDEYPGVASVG